ncbi:MAG: tRNA synthetase valyl/leucyl anticodon-binding protein, partial [Acidimicrobiales bacterium]|nr:tRNA synthetase valyl/leucyl anticodon-binding protein [Acidimicrobiales bacterium]
MGTEVPEKPSLDGLEDKWIERWESEGTYRFDRTKSRADVYSIDTPPPTVSGRLHIGHVCSYTHTDTIARYQRMRGKAVFYPMGWDDNGLNVERRAQLHYGVYCDPTLPYDPDFDPPDPPPKRPVPVSRPNFIELCAALTVELEKEYRELWTRISLSVDWSYLYRTIGPEVTRVSQLAFLRNLARGHVYRVEAPTVWDVDFRSAIAQAELEDREIPGAYHRLRFHKPDGGDVQIETTRPELVAACVALVAHPDDARYEPLFGTEVTTPLFGVRVPVLAHELADPEKGSGIAMICTFGDTTDVVWWRELGLPVRGVMGRDGRLGPVEWGEPGWESTDVDAAQRNYDELAGKTSAQAQKRIVELLRESGDLVGDPRPITHPVKFWENGTRPLEIVTNRQWFIRYPPKEVLLRRGEELRWHPEFMKVRYRNWVEGLAGDWNVTRQRFFGVPFPVWYPIDGEGEVDWTSPMAAPEERLPVDPSTAAPDGFSEDQRGLPGGCVGDPDVMDTWATSSMSPEFVSGWERDPDLFERTFPMDLRPQAHEIIRTWLFYTVVRAELEFGSLPFTDVALSGFVRDPDRKKLSKSAGNSPDDPFNVIESHGADAVRYWAAGARPGRDLEMDRNQFKIGRRLAIKLLNASKFVLSRLGPEGEITAPLDTAVLARLAGVVDEATSAFENYDYAAALDRTESFFWSFCDDYLELVKGRAYGSQGEEGAASANRALTIALSTLLRLFAPVLPYVTEEVWSWWQDGSVHRSSWPTSAELPGGGDPLVLQVAADVLAEVRKAKTEAKQSLRAEVTRVLVRDTPDRLGALRAAESDVKEAGHIADLVAEESSGFSVEI